MTRQEKIEALVEFELSLVPDFKNFSDEELDEACAFMEQVLSEKEV